jgi:hypothetical protein
MTRLTAIAFSLVLLGASAPALAQTCTVPGSHATIQAAVDDPACATINLSAQTFVESIVIRRTLTLSGAAGGNAVVAGLVMAIGSGSEVSLDTLRVENGCTPDALRASAGARIVGTDLQVEHSEGLGCPQTADTIFADGFESGDTTAWSG